LDFNGKKEVTAKIKKTLDNNTLRPKNADPAEFRKRFLPMRDKHILDGKIPDKTIHPALFLGLDFYHRHRDLCCDYESIFPLKKIKFEGVSLPCPNDPDYILTARYGDYMTLPKKLHFHTELGKIDLRENLEIKRFLGERK
jgi:hypothetical protein